MHPRCRFVTHTQGDVFGNKVPVRCNAESWQVVRHDGKDVDLCNEHVRPYLHRHGLTLGQVLRGR